MFCCGPFCQHHNLQFKCLLQCQIPLVGLKILVIFCWNMSPAGTTPNGSLVALYLPHWHANVVKYLNFLSYFRLWYPEFVLLLCAFNRLVYYLLLALCALVLLVPGWVLQDPDTGILYHKVLVLWQNHCTIQPFPLLPVVPVSGVFAVILSLLSMALVVHMLHTSVVSGMTSNYLWPLEKIFLWNILFL